MKDARGGAAKLAKAGESGTTIPRWLGYGAAVVLTAAVTLLAHELEPVWDATGRHPYLIEWPTILVAAWLGGMGPGLVATVLSTAGILFYWIEPLGALRVQHPSDLVALALYAICGVAVCSLIDRLHRVNERERELRRSREMLLGIVAHDLRNPLHSIVAATTLLRRKPDDVRRLDTIERAARRMDHLIRDLVDTSALDATGSVSMVFSEEAIASFVGEAVVTATLQATSKAITICAEVTPDLWVRCDRDRMLQVLGNLLENAVKFTPEGGRITVRAARLDPFVRIEVTDTGPGIRQEHREAVFERHWSGGKGGAGAGLGLFIARSIVRGHGGQMWLHSEPGHGTTFFLTLPAVVSASRERRAPSSERFGLS